MTDFLKKGYRVPAGVTTVSAIASTPKKKATPPAKTPTEPPGDPPAGDNPSQALDLMTAELADLVALPDVGTARGKQVQGLAQAGTLNLDTLQAEISSVNWVELYNQGKVTWPGGLEAAPAETEETEEATESSADE